MVCAEHAPVPEAWGAEGHQLHIPGADWRIDLVTATMGANLDNPSKFQAGRLCAALPFIDYLLEGRWMP